MTPRQPAIALTLLFAVTGLGQTPHWAYDIGGPSNDRVADVKTDDLGDLYITGEFSGLITFDGQSFLSNGGIDFFLAKLDSTGGLLWWTQGGGPGIDRGIKLCVGDNGTVAVAGEYMGNASISGTQLQSQAGSQDFFLASYSAATGNLQWIDDGGGALAGDRPYGVTISPSGNVTVAGEFRGTSDIGNTTLISMLDPNTLLPSVDVFIASYSSSGTPLWVKHGAAEFTDRSIDAVSDPLGNVYVCGQFSDTIAFDSTYINAMYNATFLVKYDPAGNELWFRRIGGAVYDHVRDMQWTSSGELVLLGDLQGTMIFLDQQPDVIVGTSPYNYYLMRVSSDGELLQTALTGSENPISGRALDARGDSVLVLGQFECQWTQPTDSLSTGIFMATGVQDLFTAIHPLDSLELLTAQQYGGQQEKLAGGIASLASGEAVFSGSYEDILILPSTIWGLFSGDCVGVSAGTWEYCTDWEYGALCGIESNGLKDGFIAKGWIRSRQPYDFWERDDNLCLRDRKPLCIDDGYGGCPDTIRSCGPRWLAVDPHMAWSSGNQNFSSYDLDLWWSTGTDSAHITALTTGWYWVNAQSTNGCWSFNDSVYVIINPIPPKPLISDDWVVNTSALNPETIFMCDPDSVWIWTPSLYPDATLYWSNSLDTLITQSDSVFADTSVTFHLQVVTDSGCTRQTWVQVVENVSVSIAGYTADIDVYYPQDADLNDTIVICEDGYIYPWYSPVWYVAGIPTNIPFGAGVRYRLLPGGWWSSITDEFPHGSSAFVTNSGWYYHTFQIALVNGPCGNDSLVFVGSDSVYVEVIPELTLNVVVYGPAIMCPGDTVMLVANCDTITQFQWAGQGIIEDLGDTVYLNMGGGHSAYATVLDSSGCFSQSSGYSWIAYPPDPELDVFPTDGIICPDSNAVVFTSAVGQHAWYGPNGLETSTNDSIWVNTPGEYYLQTIDVMGCLLDSDPILVSGYGTPFLNVLPDGVLCVGDGAILLQVVTTGATSLVWDAPLSGNALQQTVSLPGTYSCSVTACGIITELETTIVMGSADATLLTPGPFTICPGDTALLEATGGAAFYIWLPGNEFGSTLAVTAEGAYQAIALDAVGCADTSAFVLVDLTAYTTPLFTIGATVCEGDTAVLNAIGSGTTTWYADALLLDSLTTDSLLVLPNAMDSALYYVVQEENGCTSTTAVVALNVVPPPAAPIITGLDSVCIGATVLIEATGPVGATFSWNTPNGTVSGPQVPIASAQAIDAGLYICTLNVGGCDGPPSTFMLTVVQPQVVDLGPDIGLCPDDTVVISLPGGYTDAVWNTGSQADSIIVFAAGQFNVQVQDPFGCAVSDAINVDMLDPTLPITALDQIVCLGVDAALVASGSGNITWTSDPAGTVVVGTGTSLAVVQPTDTATYYAWQEEFGCTGEPVAATVFVVQPPIDVAIDGPSFACVGDQAQFEVVGTPGIDVVWTTPVGTSFGMSLNLLTVALSDAGWYLVETSLGGCTGATDSAWLDVFVPDTLVVSPDTVVCFGGTIELIAPPGFSDPLWSTGATSTSIVVGGGGTYSLQATDANGCLVMDAVVVTVIECIDLIPNVFTPNGDGDNDVWELGTGSFTGASLVVFDRFGDKVYEDDPRLRPFNGIHQYSHEELSEGVYFYVLAIERFGGVFDERKGYLQLVR
jgi:gliding motility-associated-like protein